jgi:hypothetical protein
MLILPPAVLSASDQNVIGPFRVWINFGEAALAPADEMIDPVALNRIGAPLAVVVMFPFVRLMFPA